MNASVEIINHPELEFENPKHLLTKVDIKEVCKLLELKDKETIDILSNI